MTAQLIDPPYGVRDKATDLTLVALTYCLKEPMELGRRRLAPCAEREKERVVSKVEEDFDRGSRAAGAVLIPRFSKSSREDLLQ
ncbi:hypothetical protein TNCV_2481711 [Trichonephila clavipes]|nr:hypothetical protein TNCV_2481711 [Trichonephila clavipes]